MALELKQHRHLRTRVSAVFLIRFFVTLTHACASLVVLLSAFFPRVHFALQEKQWKAQLRLSLPRRVLSKFRTQHVESSPGTVVSRAD